MKSIKKGDIYYANLDPTIGSEQGGIRPVIILQNNQGNKCSPTVLIAPLTKKDNNKTKIPTHINICKNEFIKHDSIILLEQIKVIDKKKINFLFRKFR